MAQSDDAPVTAKDLEGEWVGLNYFCEGPTPPQRMIVQAIGPKLIATKTLGDPCVPAGHRTWEGTISGDTITGVHYVSSGPNTSIYTIPITLKVNDVNAIDSSFGSQFRRGGSVQAEDVPDALGEVEVTVINKRTGKPVRYEYVELTADDGRLVGKTLLTRKHKGKTAFEGIEPGSYTVAIANKEWSETSRQARVTVEAGETSKIRLEIDFDKVRVTGALKALDKNNRYHKLINAKVIVQFSDGHIVNTVTGESGRFVVNYDKAPESFKVEGTLATKDGEFSVRSHAGFGGAIVRAQTRALPIETPREGGSVFLRKGSGRLSGALNAQQKASIEHGGTYYHHTYTAMKFARDTLRLRFDHKLPVDATLWSAESSGATYFRDQSKIEISGTDHQSERIDPSSPDNREYHEFGHHVMADSAIGGDNGYASRIAGETNHGGIDNGRSVDSVTEGFAEFFAIWVEGNPVYNWGAATDLENNLQNMRRYRRDSAGNIVRDAQGKRVVESVMREEFQVAALLWDLLDSNSDTGDYIDLTDQQMWAVINRVAVKDIPTIYKEVKGPLRGQRTVAGSVLDDVDTLFVAHRFYSDTNRNGRWDAGEQIGVADFYHKRGSNTIRHKIPSLENSEIEIITPDGVPKLRQVRQILHYPDGTQTDLGTHYLNDNRLTIEVPENAAYLEIQPVLAGFSPEPVRLTPEAYTEALASAMDGNDAIMLRFEIAATPVDLPAPTEASIDRDYDGLWIGWQGQGPQYVLVEGASRVPETLTDGTELYRGSERFFQHTDLDDYEQERFYAVFAIDSEGNASAPLTIVWQQESPAREGNQWWLWVLLAVIAGGLIWFLTGRRRRA